MRLITLNAWGGKLFDPFVEFIKRESVGTDVFCFQDVLFGSKPEFSPIQKGRINLFLEMEKVLPDFHSFVYRDPEESYFHGEMLPLDVGCGQAMFVRKSLQIIENGGFRSHTDSPYHKGGDMVSGRCQWVTLYSEDTGHVTVLNLHGLWQRDSKKTDTKERLEQSERIREFFASVDHKKMLCGDFNIILDSEAMRKFEEGMRNLVKEYGVQSTRNSHYPKEEKFADYILVSPEVEVKDFKVLPDEISDHLPLMMECK